MDSRSESAVRKGALGLTLWALMMVQVAGTIPRKPVMYELCNPGQESRVSSC